MLVWPARSGIGRMLSEDGMREYGTPQGSGEDNGNGNSRHASPPLGARSPDSMENLSGLNL